VIKLTNQRKQ